MQSVPRPTCYLCHAPGTILYQGLPDRLFAAAGSWNIRRCPDPDCGLLWLDPLPTDLSEAYEAYYTHQDSLKHAGRNGSLAARLRWFVKFGEFPGNHPHGNAASLVSNCLGGVTGFAFPRLVSSLPAQASGKVLDVGCGDGDLVLAMQNRGWQAQGLDPDPAAVQFARQRGAEVCLGALSDQRYDSDSFDGIVMNHAIEHVLDPVACVRECHRILRPGGRLILATPNIESCFHQKFGQHWLHLDPPRHLHLFRAQTLAEVVRRAGFPIANTFTVLGAPFAYRASQQIRCSGKFRPGGASLKVKFQEAAAMLTELLMIKSGRNGGEELRLIAEK
ncbi:MAG: class I SAM-dependent methyltransferase [Candidatus Korobacteraceae bacterium]